MPAPSRSGIAGHDVQVLDRLTRCALHEVVDGRDHDHALGRASSVAKMRQPFVPTTSLSSGGAPADDDEPLAGVGLVVEGAKVGCRRQPRRAHVDRLDDAAVDRHEVRHEGHRGSRRG